MRKLLVLVMLVSLAGWADAALIAADNANQVAYDAGWTNGSNGGFGFGPWTLNAGANAGFFIGSSANNGTAPSGGIDVNGESWGLWANNGSVAEAVRPFVGALSVGQSFLIDFDNGWIDTGFSVGIALRNANSENLVEWYFTGGDAYYTLHRFGGPIATSNAWTDGGLRLQFDLVEPTNFLLTVIQGGTPYHYGGHLLARADQGVAQVRVWNYSAGPGSQRDAFINNMEIIPEPATILLGLLGAGALLWRRIRVS